MTAFYRVPSPQLHLYRLTLQMKGAQSNAYSMGESVEDAFSRYIDRAIKQKENATDIKFVQGDLADPHTHLRQSR
jgi:hypothetical protein